MFTPAVEHESPLAHDRQSQGNQNIQNTWRGLEVRSPRGSIHSYQADYSGQLDAFNNDRLDRTVHAASADLGDLVDDPSGLFVSDFTKDGMTTVEVRRRGHSDEELGPIGTRTGIGHSQQVGLRESELWVKLVGESVPGTARTGAERAAALNHEPVNDAVEGQAVVEPTSGRLTGVRIDVLLRAAGQTDEIVDSLGSLIGKEVNDDVAVIGAQSRGRGHLPAFL